MATTVKPFSASMASKTRILRLEGYEKRQARKIGRAGERMTEASELIAELTTLGYTNVTVTDDGQTLRIKADGTRGIIFDRRIALMFSPFSLAEQVVDAWNKYRYVNRGH
jgi:hypothetical protein